MNDLNITFRAFRDEQDYDEMVRVFNTYSDAVHMEYHETVDDMRNMLENAPNFVMSDDLRLIEVSGEVVAYGRVGVRDLTTGERNFRVAGFVHPAYWGRGIGRALLAWQEQQAKVIDARLSTPSKGKRVMNTWSDANTPGKTRFLERSGYVAVRYGAEMVRPNMDDIPNFQLPDDLETRPIHKDNLPLMRQIWEADSEAFADHWGYSVPTEEDYARWLNDTYTQPHLFKVAFDKATGDVAGMVLNFIPDAENARLNRKRGFTEGISTRRKYRKRGVAHALICESLRMLREMGMTEAALGVDTENLTGAFRVYEDCGFRKTKLDTTYWKEF